MKAHQIMSRNVVTVTPAMPVRDIAALMTEKRISGVPVVSADGTVDLVNLTGPARQPVELGTYRMQFPLQTNDANTLAGSINDVEGLLQISGKIELQPDRSYVLDALVATQPNAPAEFTRTLEFLGPPDAQGRRPFSLSGTM